MSTKIKKIAAFIFENGNHVETVTVFPFQLESLLDENKSLDEVVLKYLDNMRYTSETRTCEMILELDLNPIYRKDFLTSVEVKATDYVGLTEFVALVSEMRETQKQYFETRQKTALWKSKDLEKQTDLFIKKIQES